MHANTLLPVVLDRDWFGHDLAAAHHAGEKGRQRIGFADFVRHSLQIDHPRGTWQGRRQCLFPCSSPVFDAECG